MHALSAAEAVVAASGAGACEHCGFGGVDGARGGRALSGVDPNRGCGGTAGGASAEVLCHGFDGQVPATGGKILGTWDQRRAACGLEGVSWSFSEMG